MTALGTFCESIKNSVFQHGKGDSLESPYLAPWLPFSLLPSLFFISPSSIFVFYPTLTRRKRKELLTTETELKAMAAEARIGLSRIPQKG